MKKALIDKDNCQNCIPCMIQENCPKTAIIREEAAAKPWVDFYRCSGCMQCMDYCVNGAVIQICHPCDGKARIGW